MRELFYIFPTLLVLFEIGGGEFGQEGGRGECSNVSGKIPCLRPQEMDIFLI